MAMSSNQSNHPGGLEECQICSEYTGRAGRADDSIYWTLVAAFTTFGFGLEVGDEVGPLCEDCNRSLERLGLVEGE